MKKLTNKLSLTCYFSITPVLFRQLAGAIHRNLPMHEVASILAQDDKTNVHQWWHCLSKLATALKSGHSLSAAMGPLGYAFPKATVDWIALAEQKEVIQKGVLEDTLSALANDAERENRGRGELGIALIWPTALLSALLVCLVVASLFVFPAFIEMYESFAAPLPDLTLSTIDFALVATQHWWAWLLPTVVLVVMYWRRYLPNTVLYELDSAIHSIWFVRRVVQARFISRLVGLLITTNGDAALQRAALAHISCTVSSRRLLGIVRRVDTALSEGKPISQAFIQEDLLPKRLGLYCQLGEKLGDFASPLTQLQQSADEAQHTAITQFERTMVLLVYVFLATVIGLFATAVYLPIFKLGQVL